LAQTNLQFKQYTIYTNNAYKCVKLLPIVKETSQQKEDERRGPDFQVKQQVKKVTHI